MKPIFLFLFVTTMMTCTIHGQSSQHKENQLPDWAFGGFERPKNVNPVISPIENTKFYCPLTKDSIAWESNDTFNPAATLYNGECRRQIRSRYRPPYFPSRLCHFHRRHPF